MTTDPSMWLAAEGRQVTAPHSGAQTALPAQAQPWLLASRIAPAAVTATAWLLARLWHLETGGSVEPLVVGGALSALSATAGILSASRGVSAVAPAALTAAGALAVVSVTAWTPTWSLSVLLWLMATAGIYACCVPAWRQEHQRRQRQAHAVQLQRVRDEGQLQRVGLQAAAAVEVARHTADAQRAAVEAIVAASTARQHRVVEPGRELDVDALLSAAGHGRTALTAEAELGHDVDM